MQEVYVVVAHLKGQVSVTVYENLGDALHDADSYNADCTNPSDRIDLTPVSNNDLLHLNGIFVCPIERGV